MKFNNELLLTLLIYAMIVAYSFMNFSKFITENPNTIVVFALLSVYLVKKVQSG